MKFDYTWLKDKEEPLARLLTAEAMGLVKDPHGERLPYELWCQKITEARKLLGLDNV